MADDARRAAEARTRSHSVPRHIGIAAVSPEGSALCYREIFRQASKLIGPSGHPTVTIHNEPLELYVAAVMRNDWVAVGEMLHRSAKVLAAAGAEFVIVPDNLMQFGIHLAETGSPIPFLTMTELVADAVVRDGRKTLGLMGTKLVMQGSMYQTFLGLRGVKVLVPSEAEADEVDSIIFSEMVYGVARKESRERLKSIIQSLANRGCDGTILAWSEAQLLLNDDDPDSQGKPIASIPVYDPSELLAQGAAQVSLGRRPIR
jgi:aspartate racemase